MLTNEKTRWTMTYAYTCSPWLKQRGTNSETWIGIVCGLRSIQLFPFRPTLQPLIKRSLVMKKAVNSYTLTSLRRKEPKSASSKWWQGEKMNPSKKVPSCRNSNGWNFSTTIQSKQQCNPQNARSTYAISSVGCLTCLVSLFTPIFNHNAPK